MSLDVWKEPDKRTPPSTMKVMIQRTAHPGMSIIGVLGDLCQLFPTPPDLKQNKTFCVLKTRAFFPLSAPSTIALPWQGKHLAAMAVWQAPPVQNRAHSMRWGTCQGWHRMNWWEFFQPPYAWNLSKGLSKKPLKTFLLWAPPPLLWGVIGYN